MCASAIKLHSPQNLIKKPLHYTFQQRLSFIHVIFFKLSDFNLSCFPTFVVIYTFVPFCVSSGCRAMHKWCIALHIIHISPSPPPQVCRTHCVRWEPDNVCQNMYQQSKILNSFNDAHNFISLLALLDGVAGIIVHTNTFHWM